MEAGLREAVGAALGSEVARVAALSGGDINDAFSVSLVDGRRVFVKSNRRVIAGMFAAEARGLAWLDAVQAVRVPRVIGVDERFLVLELIPAGAPAPSFDAQLGRALAALHRAGPATFGLDHDNFIGRLPQSNRPAARWSDFYARERILPQVRRATDAGLLPAVTQRDIDRLLDVLDDRVGPEELPARLHGDLWSGNLMRDERGEPCLIDPAVYGGHREVDLAMMRLFGGFSEATFAAYDEAFPLAAGHAERTNLYQLYPLLVHVNLFGASYVGAVDSALATLV